MDAMCIQLYSRMVLSADGWRHMTPIDLTRLQSYLLCLCLWGTPFYGMRSTSAAWLPLGLAILLY